MSELNGIVGHLAGVRELAGMGKNPTSGVRSIQCEGKGKQHVFPRHNPNLKNHCQSKKISWNY